MIYETRYSASAGCWSVGFYDGAQWEPVSDHSNGVEAADAAARMNGYAPAGTCTDRLRRLLGSELTCADLDALDDDALRSLRNILDHWRQLAELRIERRQGARHREATTTD